MCCVSVGLCVSADLPASAIATAVSQSQLRDQSPPLTSHNIAHRACRRPRDPGHGAARGDGHLARRPPACSSTAKATTRPKKRRPRRLALALARPKAEGLGGGEGRGAQKAEQAWEAVGRAETWAGAGVGAGGRVAGLQTEDGRTVNFGSSSYESRLMTYVVYTYSAERRFLFAFAFELCVIL